MKRKKSNVYHGYLAFSRHSKLLMDDLGHSWFGFYVGLVMEAIWYRNNPDFGRIVKSQTEIASALGCSQSTVSRGLSLLERKKYLIRHDEYILLVYYPLFRSDVAYKMHSKSYANKQELYADMHKVNAELQETHAELQGNQSQNIPKPFYVSSKDNLSSSSSNTVEELNRYFRENPLDESKGGL